MKVSHRAYFHSAIFTIVCFLSYSLANGQSRITVLDEKLKPISGASVQNLTGGTTQITDVAGLVMTDLTGEAKIKISHVGYQSNTIVLLPNTEVRVILNIESQNLGSVQVEGFLRESNTQKQAGAISLIKPNEFNRFNAISMVNAVNTLPGIRFEERAGGSYRVSIRGSSIRSPFGVRNVKVYWNGIPFTEPGGNTFINLLDLSNVGSLEIIKGPSGSLFGAGTGGTIKIKSTSLGDMANKVELGLSGGSFGLRKAKLSLNALNDQTSMTLKYASQSSDGYRDHNEFDRKTMELDLVLFSEKNRTVMAGLLYSNLFYEIPGGLNPDQLTLNPRQARPGSESQNASIANKMTLLRIGQEYNWSSGLSNETNIYGSFSEFANPFNLDFKRDNQQVFGGRSVFNRQLKKFELTAGGEYQYSFFDGKNFGNVGGQADTVRFVDEVITTSANVFGQANFELSEGLFFNAGLSVNTLEYDINRLIDAFGNSPQRVEKKFKTAWLPRIAISKKLNDGLSAHLSLSKGFSPPSTTEVRTNEGTLSLGLEPEKGTNYEFNLRGNLLKKSVSFDLAAFLFKLDETIVSNPDSQGVVLFANAGNTYQQGLELQLNGNLLSSETGFIREINTGVSYTYHDFEYRNYVKGANDFSGNALPGTAPSIFNFKMDITLSKGFSVNMNYQYVDPVPLNDANNFYSNAYHLVNTRFSYENLGSKSLLNLFFGIDNLTNAHYSLGNDLNAFGRRYFQPAPEINYYFGLNIKFDYKK